MLLLALLVAAAVVVPVVLIVLPRQKHAASSGASSSSGTCIATNPCLNGGLSVASGTKCGCICRAGFTGDDCDVAGDPGCITIELDAGSETINDATVGSAIPRLFRDSEANYSIPLNGSKILTLFAAGNISCTAENGLVSFNGRNLRSRGVDQIPEIDVETAASSTISFVPTPIALPTTPPEMVKRQVGTSFGIVFQVSSAAEPTPSAGSRESNNASTTQSSSKPASSTGAPRPSSTEPSPEVFDFARISVLYLLEKTQNMDTAIQAQDLIKMFVSDRTNWTDTITFRSENMDMNLNFGDFSIRLGTDDDVGGRGDGKGKISKDR